MKSLEKARRRASASAPKEVLLRGLLVLEALNQRQVSKLDFLASATSLPKPTLVYILSQLTRAGYVRRLPKRRGYTLDERVLTLSRGFRLEEAIVTAAIPVLTAFTTRYKWPLAIATRDGNTMRVRESTHSLSPLSVDSDDSFIGRRIGFLPSALGRAYLAFCPDEERREILLAIAATERSAQSIADWRVDERLVREATRTGYTTSAPIHGDPAVGLAVPVVRSGRVVACISLRYLGRAITKDEIVRRYLAPLQQAAAEIAASL